MIRALRPILLAASLSAAPALAQAPGIDAARASGAIGERYDGYLGIAEPVPPAVRTQVSGINIRRRSLYSNLAASRGASPQEVGITAGCQLLARVAVGQAYMLSDGTWRRRAAGQAAPVPDYCR
jgi:uncharacterized protein YdbL (DUF1318 family)